YVNTDVGSSIRKAIFFRWYPLSRTA
ncbi:hypothetical protein CUMW_128710, partial [Citrus unshiu]